MSGLIERMQHYVFPVSATSLNPSEGLSLKIELDAPFRLFGIVAWNLGVVSTLGVDGQIAVRFAGPDGRQIQRQLTASNLLAPGNQYNLTGLSPNKALAAPIHPGILYPAGSVIDVDVIGLNTGIVSPEGVILIFVGTNIYQKSDTWAPEYPAKWTARPYLDNLTLPSVAVPGGLPSLNNPFTAQADSDFVWQLGEYTDLAFTGGGCGGGGSDDICQLVDLGIMIRDPIYKAYSNDFVPVGLLFPFLGAQAPGWLYPEIYVPRLSQLYFDFKYLVPGFTPTASPVTITLGLKGMKVYAQ